MRRRFDRPRNARWPILAILLALIAALFAPGIASAQPGRTYTIATDLTFAPFEFENEDGKLVGIDIDLLNAIAEDQGFKVDIKQLGFDAALQAVQAGQADGVIAGMSITDARKQVFDFSDPYFESGVQMAVLETDNDVKSYEDLRGKRVAVKNGTEGASFAESIKDQYGFTTVYFADSASMYDEVRTGNSVAVFDDYPVLAYGITQGNGLKTVTEKEVGASGKMRGGEDGPCSLALRKTALTCTSASSDSINHARGMFGGAPGGAIGRWVVLGLVSHPDVWMMLTMATLYSVAAMAMNASSQ